MSNYPLPPDLIKILNAYAQTEIDLHGIENFNACAVVDFIQKEYHFPTVLEDRMVLYLNKYFVK